MSTAINLEGSERRSDRNRRFPYTGNGAKRNLQIVRSFVGEKFWRRFPA